MGKEEEKLARLRDLGEYKVTRELMSLAKPRRDLHPLPSRRSRLRGRGGGDRRAAERGVGRGRESTARAEGAAGVAASPGVAGPADREQAEGWLASRWDRLNGRAARRRSGSRARARGVRHGRRASAVDRGSRFRGHLDLGRRGRRTLLDPVRDARRSLDRTRHGRPSGRSRPPTCASREGASRCARRCCGCSASC